MNSIKTPISSEGKAGRVVTKESGGGRPMYGEGGRLIGRMPEGEYANRRRAGKFAWLKYVVGIAIVSIPVVLVLLGFIIPLFLCIITPAAQCW